ncbi:hypothetical protein UlMin_000120 [Ulmus minor]
MVCKLKKSLYGLKQSPKKWNKRSNSFVTSIGCSKSFYDACLYFKGNKIDDITILLLYVDDTLLTSKTINNIIELKKILSEEFEMKDLGRAKKILGTNIVRNIEKNVLKLHQRTYLEKILTKFSMNAAKLVTLPLANHFKLKIH